MTEAPDLSRRRFLLGRPAESTPAQRSPFAVIDASCLAFHGTACMSCRDACPTGAVRLELAIGGARPRIDQDTCTGCGDCLQACPVDALQLPSPTEVA